MKNMRQIVDELRRQGHNVTFYNRRDGGILIKSIDGQRYTGAMGNKIGRAMLGQTLSTKRAVQLYDITFNPKSERQKSIISYKEEAVKKELKRVQRIWNKAFKKTNFKEGKKTAKKVKWNIEHKGVEETMRLLKEAERYATGKAYSKNIEYLATEIEETGKTTKSPELLQLAEDIRENAYKIEEDTIEPAYKELYKINDGVPPSEVARAVRKILKLST